MYLKHQKNYSKILSEKFEHIRNIEVLLDVDFPLLFSFDANGKNYLAYVLEYKKRKNILDVYLVETTSEKIVKLLNQKISLKAALTSEDAIFLNLNNIHDYDPEEIQKKLPKESFYLTELLPNKIDIAEKRIIFDNKNSLDNAFEIKESQHNFNKNILLNKKLFELSFNKSNFTFKGHINEISQDIFSTINEYINEDGLFRRPSHHQKDVININFKGEDYEH